MANSDHRFLSILVLALVILTLDAALAAKFTSTINEIACKNLTKNIASCWNFITGRNPTPSTSCCEGAKILSKAAKTPADKQALCECLKTELARVKGINYDKYNEIPKACGIKIDWTPITNTTDCKSIKLKDLYG